jgi:PHD/YefM family antitoxin component YafN of YafNO toxin-antitoxin module
MKTVAANRLTNRALLGRVLVASRKAVVVVTSKGRPVAVIHAVPPGWDMEDVYWATNPEVWAQIERGRAASARARRSE